MTAKHTPGPWRNYRGGDVHPSFDGPSPQTTNDSTIICECLGPDMLANARLIAAAPELAEALKNTLQFAEACHRTCDDALMRKAIGADIMRAREALEKAGVA